MVILANYSDRLIHRPIIKLSFMNHLPDIYYTWFPVEQSQPFPIYINFLKLKEIQVNSHFVEILKVSSALNPPLKYRHSILSQSKIKEMLTSSELLLMLQNIHFKPIVRTNCFNEKNQRQGLSSYPIWLPAERFYWEFPCMNLGSSRHILLKSIQLKGSGANPMSVRFDNAHSWGGSYLWSNLKGLSFNILYKGILSKGIQELITISISPEDYHDKKISTYELNSVVARDAKSYRLTQLMGGIDTHHPYKKSYQEMVGKLIPEFFEEYLDGLYFQYGQMLCLGICDLNITKENVMIDGSLIDYEDISYLGDELQQLFTLKLYYADKLENKKDLFEMIKESSVYLSDYHLYLDAIEMSCKTYNRFFDENYKQDTQKGFFDFLINYRDEVYSFSDEHFRLLEILSSHSALYRNGNPYFNLAEGISEDLYQFLKDIDLGHVELTEADDGNTVLNISLSFPRGKWLNSSLQNYYEIIKIKPVKDIAIPILRLLEVYIQDREKIDLSQAVEFSSKVNQVVSRNSWISPYNYENKKFKLNNFSKIIDIENEVFKKTNFKKEAISLYHGVAIGSRVEYKSMTHDELSFLLSTDNVFILQGLTIKHSDFNDHYVPLNLYISKK